MPDRILIKYLQAALIPVNFAINIFRYGLCKNNLFWALERRQMILTIKMYGRCSYRGIDRRNEGVQLVFTLSICYRNYRAFNGKAGLQNAGFNF